MTEVERLSLVAEAVDDFESELSRLQSDLITIGGLVEDIFPIHADTRGVPETVAELEMIDSAVESIDDDVTVDVDSNTDGDIGGGDGLFGGFNEAEQNAAASFIGPYQFQSPDSPIDDVIDAANDGGGSTVADGGAAAYDLGTDKNILPSSLPDPSIRSKGNESLTEQFLDMQLVMGDLFKILAALAPLIGVFIGALPAAISGVVALGAAALAAAGALGAVGGLALMGLAMDGNLQSELQETATAFKEAFGPVANTLAPVARTGFRDLRSLIRDLGSSATTLQTLTDDFRAFTGFLSNSTAPVLTDIVNFGEAAIPTLVALGDAFPEMDVLSILGGVAADTLPLLVSIMGDIGLMLPVIYNLSQGFLVVVGALMWMGSVVAQVLNLIPFGVEIFGVLIGTLLTLITVSAMYTVVAKSMQSGILSLSGSVLYNVKAFNLMTAAEIKSTLAMVGLRIATLALYSALTFGLAWILGELTMQFSGLTGQIDSATKSLREFKSVGNSVSGMNFGGPAVNGGGTPQGRGVTYNEFNVSANSREQANRTAESLRYMEGTRRDSEFVRGYSG